MWMALFPVVDDVIGRVLAYCPLCQNLVAIGPGVKDLGPISGFEGVFPAVDDVTTRPMTSFDHFGILSPVQIFGDDRTRG